MFRLGKLHEAGLIQDNFFHFGTNLPKDVPNHSSELVVRKGAQGSNFAPSFAVLS